MLMENYVPLFEDFIERSGTPIFHNVSDMSITYDNLKDVKDSLRDKFGSIIDDIFLDPQMFVVFFKDVAHAKDQVIHIGIKSKQFFHTIGRLGNGGMLVKYGGLDQKRSKEDLPPGREIPENQWIQYVYNTAVSIMAKRSLN